MLHRRRFLAACAGAGLTSTFASALWQQAEAATATLPAGPGAGGPVAITREMIAAAEGLLGLSYTDAERDLMIGALESHLASHRARRAIAMPNAVQPATQYSARLPGRTYAGSARRTDAPATSRPSVQRPDSDVDLAFLSVVELAELLRTRRVTAVELTRLYLERLRRFDETLNCVVTLTEERALRQAADADRDIAAGRYRGPLHGIPYGVKDVLSLPGYPTTWGIQQFETREFPEMATAIDRLDKAGAILVAKLALGELGLSDLWYRGQTMNAWAPTLGATGSSAGSATATAAGLVAFALGVETMGSIVVPASNNGITALRPTFGRVSRHGALTLCWSLDKIGPMARTVEDCAIVLEAIAGPDGIDATCADVPYAWDPARPLSSVRVGYFKGAFDMDRATKDNDHLALQDIRALGVTLHEVELPTDLPINDMLIVRTEAAAALDEIARRDDVLAAVSVQTENGWPNFIRAAQFVPAVEYLQATRMRTLLMERMDRIFRDVDVFLAPTFGVIPIANLAGLPCVVTQNGFRPNGIPHSISFIGRPFGEAELCTVARAWQESTPWHRRHPPPFAEH